jgi:hypothetical protein
LLAAGHEQAKRVEWHGVPVLPRSGKDLESSLRKLAPAVLVE